MTIVQVIVRSVLAIIIGGLIGTERARHGRAAGMRTHILVCLGAMLTSMTGIFVSEAFGTGDVLRISAQVVSGVGFLGAGMIILKNGNIITGLTTAAGVWTTATIGVALGYGFYTGAIAVAVLFLTTVIFFAKFERKKRSVEVIYIESDNMNRLNELINNLKAKINADFSISVVQAKSGTNGHIGLHLIFKNKYELDFSIVLEMENVVFAVEE